jgi:hypothetical protein
MKERLQKRDKKERKTRAAAQKERKVEEGSWKAVGPAFLSISQIWIKKMIDRRAQNER